jgi:AcrR family transcriptional regulator
MGKGKEQWITAGYTEFAKYGPEGKNIDRLATLVGKSRSSFYHNFADQDGYEEALFHHHQKLTHQLAEEIAPLENMFPQYAIIISRYRDWMFFHREMFLLQHRDKKYKEVFERTVAVTGGKAAKLWCKEAGLCNVPHAKMMRFFNTVREAFFTRIEYNSFTPETFTSVVKELNQAFSFLVD